MYIRAVQRDVMQVYQKQAPFRRNLSRSELKALNSLSSRSDIIIKPADKGGAVVVMNTSDYTAEAHKQLSDTKFYKQLDYDPTEEHKLLVKRTILDLITEKKMADSAIHSLIPLSPVAGRFYLLPKIHKKDNPGRPIISGIGTVTENLSSYVDSLISNIPATFPSFVRDTTHFLSDLLDITIPKGSLLVTLDVASLYTNIPHTDGIGAVVKSYEEMSAEKTIDSSTLATLLKLILDLNNFEFDGTHYNQISGTSMGTRIGPNYANIFYGPPRKQIFVKPDT